MRRYFHPQKTQFVQWQENEKKKSDEWQIYVSSLYVLCLRVVIFQNHAIDFDGF